jgi:hypothetical protein
LTEQPTFKSVRTIKVTNGTLTDDGDGVVTLDTGGVETLEELTDVNIIGTPDQGDVISYNTGTSKWMRNGGLQQLLARFKASGNGAQMYDTLSDTTKGYVDILANSATMKVNNSGLTITEASPGVLSLSVAAGTEGNEVEFEAFVITGSDTLTTAADVVFKYGSKTYWEVAGGKKIFLRALNTEEITVVLPSTGGQLALTTDIPSVPVDSVNGQTGVVVLDTGDIDENGNLYYTDTRVAANSAVAANTAKVGLIAGGTTGQALIKTTGTDYDVEWSDQYHDRYQTQSEALRAGATATTEIYYSAQADGDGYAQSASSDSPTAGNVINRKIYYSEAGFADPDTGTWVEFTPAPADDATFATVKAALLEYLKARTGGTVPISLKQTWVENTPSTYLLDQSYGTGAAAAYSTRQLRLAQTECMTIRRASDGTTTTIGFDGSGNIDEAAITTFCTGTTCSVQTWIDQSGNGNNATAPSTGAEPTIYTGGALVKQGGRLALDFDGVSDALNSASNVSMPLNNTIAIVAQGTSTTTDEVFNINGTAGVNIRIQTAQYKLLYSDLDQSFITSATNNQFLVFAGRQSSSDTVHGSIDGGAQLADTSNPSSNWNTATAKIHIGARNGTSLQWDGKVQEVIYYESDELANRTDIEENIGDYYTQNTPLLDTYSGAAAAYSLRLLDSTYTGSAIRVRRSSDNTEQDIGFNVFGELDTVSLTAFAGVGDAFCKVWYDQSGSSNDATQTTTADQPKIVSSGAVITGSISGKPTIFFDTSDKMPTTTTASTQTLSLFSVAQGKTGRKTILDIGSSNGFDLRTWSDRNYRLFWGDGSTQQNIESPTTSKTETVYSVSKTSTTLNVYLNSSLDGSASTSLYTSNTINISATGQLGGTANISEIILYTSDESANRTGIETNVNTFYSIF